MCVRIPSMIVAIPRDSFHCILDETTQRKVWLLADGSRGLLQNTREIIQVGMGNAQKMDR